MIMSVHSMFSRDTGTISFPRNFGAFLNISPQQQIRVYGPKDQRQLLASMLSLTSRLVFHRLYTRNVAGALNAVSKVYAENNVNIVKSEVTTFGGICMLELVADFSFSTSRLHELTEFLLKECGQLVIQVSHPEMLTEFFPASFYLKDALQAVIRPKVGHQKTTLKIPEDFFPYIGVDWHEDSYVILTAWDRASTISTQFLEPDAQLVVLDIDLKEIPGALANCSHTLANYLDLKAINAGAIVLGKTRSRFLGTLRRGNASELVSALEKTPDIMRVRKVEIM